ncbi:hypothetical protein Glove_155g75 [Diversispora epigaea]|uniref:Protein kinase domain-containing protein n=1 Tax=Diversispora epigaea TaxID=1348612 RepID=A0A397IWR7_9GLOM|nr:hypothetical protein Glove_155g75 [Diversispora epigaea]
MLLSIASSLVSLHEENLVHCGLHSGNILNYAGPFPMTSVDLECKLENDLILNVNTSEEMNLQERVIFMVLVELCIKWLLTTQRPFADQAHDTYLMIDICNGVRPKVPDFMLNLIPEWYLNLMYRYWSDYPSERPTAAELCDSFCELSDKLNYYIVDNSVMQQLAIADENQQNISKSQKQELFDLFSHSSKLHPQSYYIGQSIHTLYGLDDILKEIRSGNLQLKPIYEDSNSKPNGKMNILGFDLIPKNLKENIV